MESKQKMDEPATYKYYNLNAFTFKILLMFSYFICISHKQTLQQYIVAVIVQNYFCVENKFPVSRDIVSKAEMKVH